MRHNGQPWGHMFSAAKFSQRKNLKTHCGAASANDFFKCPHHSYLGCQSIGKTPHALHCRSSKTPLFEAEDGKEEFAHHPLCWCNARAFRLNIHRNKKPGKFPGARERGMAPMICCSNCMAVSVSPASIIASACSRYWSIGLAPLPAF